MPDCRRVVQLVESTVAKLTEALLLLLKIVRLQLSGLYLGPIEELFLRLDTRDDRILRIVIFLVGLQILLIDLLFHLRHIAPIRQSATVLDLRVEHLCIHLLSFHLVILHHDIDFGVLLSPLHGPVLLETVRLLL